MASWSAALEGGEGDGVRPLLLAQAGPWVRWLGLPGLAAFGLRWLGPATERDTAFANRYGEGRRQRLLTRARPLRASDMPLGRVDAAIVSPLHRGDVAAAMVPALRERGAFVALDAQGLMRTVGSDGRVRIATPRGREAMASADVVTFSEREFAAWTGGGDWRRQAVAVAQEIGVELLLTRGAEGVALVSGGAVVEVAADATVVAAGATVDSTGAGDVLLAGYTAARLAGRDPVAALTEAADGTAALLRRRPLGPRGVALIRELRRLHACVLALRRLSEQGWQTPADRELFAGDSALVVAVNAQLPQAVVGADVAGDAAERAARLLSGCWALLSAGWPDVADLSAEVVGRSLDAEVRRVRAVGGR